jgi:hypothetical protein
VGRSGGCLSWVMGAPEVDTRGSVQMWAPEWAQDVNKGVKHQVGCGGHW